MNILYIANIRLSTERAHGIQVMKMCEGFARLGAVVTLAVPTRKTTILEDPFSYYKVAPCFRIVRIPVLDTVSFGKIGFWFETLLFSEFVSWYALFSRYDVIYSREILPLSFLSLLKKNLVWESHRGEYNRIAKRLFSVCRKIVVISEGLKKFYVKKGIKEERIIVAHDGVDFSQSGNTVSKTEARKRLGLPNEGQMAFYIGSLEEWKGYKTFLESHAYASDILFVVVGGNESNIEKLSREFPEVCFLGERPYRELQDNQRAADVLVVPNTLQNKLSSEFTSPLKVFAHMASGVPIVSSDVPSLRNILSDESAVFVEPDNPRALADGIRKVLSDKERSKDRVLYAQKEVIKYSWESRARKIMDAIDK